MQTNTQVIHGSGSEYYTHTKVVPGNFDASARGGLWV